MYSNIIIKKKEAVIKCKLSCFFFFKLTTQSEYKRVRKEYKMWYIHNKKLYTCLSLENKT